LQLIAQEDLQFVSLHWLLTHLRNIIPLFFRSLLDRLAPYFSQVTMI